MIIVQHHNGFLFYVLADFVDENIDELFGLRSEILGFGYEAQYNLPELRMKRTNGVDQISEEDCQVDVGWIDLVPHERQTRAANEFTNERRLSAARIGAYDRRRLIDKAANPIDQSRAGQYPASQPRRH